VIQQGIAAAGRVFEVLDTLPDVEERKDAHVLAKIENAVEFDHVDFRYSEEGEYILKDVTFQVPTGGLVAVVGSSGAGKTTLVDLLPRFYDPQNGAIRIDGRDIRDVSLSSLRSQIGIVSQHTILFNDTVRNNITYGTPDASGEAERMHTTSSHGSPRGTTRS
jgi:subfamily B ATP-binding cassette protein MsbA